MQEAVSDILIDRARDDDGISRMVMLSLVAHAMLIADDRDAARGLASGDGRSPTRRR